MKILEKPWKTHLMRKMGRSVETHAKVPTKVGEASMEDITDGGEQVPEFKEIVDEKTLEDLTNGGEVVPTTEVPPDEGEDKLEIDDESNITKEEFLQLNNDAKVVSKKSGGLYKDQSMSGLNPPNDVSGEEKIIGINTL